ncbi:MAG: hypothetical protein ABFS34_11905 [Gemmatimonadota bacterium]
MRQRNAIIDWLRFGAITGLVFAAGVGVAAWRFELPGPQLAVAMAAAFAFGATIEWISLKFRGPATAFAVILTIAFVGTLEAYAPGDDGVAITQDLQALTSVLTDPDTAVEAAERQASVARNVATGDALAAERAQRQAERQSREGDSTSLAKLLRKGVRRSGGAGSP